MTKRALLIGAQSYDLTGVHADVALMERVLADRGFTDIRVCADAEAGYHGMADALATLADETKEGDAVVVYYSGHGSLLPVPPAHRGDLPGSPHHLQYLVPVDHRHSTADDFRGYLAEELTAVLRRITGITRNVTCVLDCCHSGGMVRDTGGWRTKSVLSEVPVEAGLARSVELATGPRSPDPHVVRLVATQRHGFAYEDDRQGLFTAGLAEALEDFRDRPVPWSVLIARIRDRVQPRAVLQRPDAGGPSGRLPFSLDVPDQPERMPLASHDGRLRVPGGVLFGLGARDRVRLVLPAGGSRAETTAETEVLAVEVTDALLDAPAIPFPSPLPPGSYALAVRVHTRLPVHIATSGPFAEALRTRLASSPRLTEATRADKALASVRMRNGVAEVVDGNGLPYRHPDKALDSGSAPPSASAGKVVALLETIARGERLRELTDPEDPGRLNVELTARMEVETAPGSCVYRTFRTGDEGLRAGCRYRISVAGGATHHKLYVWVLGVGLSGRTTLVTHDQPSGIRLEPDAAPGADADTVTWDSGPVEIWWPDDVPAKGSRPESVLLLVGDRQLDLSPLVAAVRNVRAEPAALSALLDEVCDGVRDSRRQATTEALRYRVFSWHTTVEPPPRPGATAEERGERRNQ
ncbi:caspase domain-containing protein [Streptomyces sp. NPDC018833]|uniref:caspase domain-containing protein n=1 Tax=Streptomyces sp. NPDC018833 TaxID=3365053 RepID=UPI0037A3652D